MEGTCVRMDRRCKLGVLFNDICKTKFKVKNNVINLW